GVLLPLLSYADRNGAQAARVVAGPAGARRRMALLGHFACLPRRTRRTRRFTRRRGRGVVSPLRRGERGEELMQAVRARGRTFRVSAAVSQSVCGTERQRRKSCRCAGNPINMTTLRATGTQRKRRTM